MNTRKPKTGLGHARRDYAAASKAMGKRYPKAVKQSAACQALARIGIIHKLEGAC
jgi:hypothetical protein